MMLRFASRTGRNYRKNRTSLLTDFHKKENNSSSNPHMQAIRPHFFAARVSETAAATTTTTPGDGHNMMALWARRRQVGGQRSITGSSNAGGTTAEAASIPAAPASNIKFVVWYLKKLEQYPLRTKALTAATIYTVSDLTSQGITAATAKEGEVVRWDAIRTLRMLAVGLFMSGPSLHLWFGSVAKLYPNRDLYSTLKKLVLGQVIFGPLFCAAFFSINAFAQGERGSQITHRLQRDLIPTLKTGLMYWPVCDFMTYRYIPVHLQPFFSNCCSFLWTIYITYVAGKKAVVDSEPASESKAS